MRLPTPNPTGPKALRRRRAAAPRAWHRLLLATVIALTALAVPRARAENITEVLERSQQMQLDALRAMVVDASDPKVRKVQASFDKVLGHLVIAQDVPLLVVRGPLLAVCLMGRIVVANEQLADLGESEREFILAHELGHVAHAHWAQLTELYRQFVPGEVVREQTDAVAGMLGREASLLAHQHEYEADAFAWRLLQRIGAPEDTPIVLFQQHLPLVKATATHPGTAQRLAHLREVR
jgi:Zn-dependent protease with chaperone function